MFFDCFRKKAMPRQSDAPIQDTQQNQSEFGDRFGKCGSAAHWKYDAANHTFVISGEGVIEKFENINDYPRRTIPDAITEITIPEGITGIESMAFCRFKNLKTVTLPKSITQISKTAFARAEEMVFLVQKDSNAETIADSNGWKKAYYPVTKERYTYYVAAVSSTTPWIIIQCNEEDPTWDSEPFTDLVKKAAGIVNNGIWEGNILPAGSFQGDSRYRIKNDPLFLVYQYDTLFGIVIEYPSGVGLNGMLNYLSDVLGITVEERFRKPIAETNPAPPTEIPKTRWQVVCDGAASLHIFKEVNEQYLQDDGYRKLLRILSEKYTFLDKTVCTNPQWKESSRQLSITGRYEAWVGHDDTITEHIEMKFRRLQPWEWDEPAQWSAESEWPCEGECQYINESKDEGDRWSYSIMTHKAWMLKAPFGLPGVWSFEYISKSDR